jgi:thiol-disulfide isomerase/thioredoxin
MKAFRVVALSLFALALPLAISRAQEEGIGVGKAAPMVKVSDLDGKVVDFGQYIGKTPVFIEFWATWCPICEALLPRVQAAHARYAGRVEFLGVNVAVNQTRDRVRRYMTQHTMPFQVVYDDEGVSTRAYDAPQTSYIVIVDRSGKVVYTGVGTDQKFEDALARVAAP